MRCWGMLRPSSLSPERRRVFARHRRRSSLIPGALRAVEVDAAPLAGLIEVVHLSLPELATEVELVSALGPVTSLSGGQ